MRIFNGIYFLYFSKIVSHDQISPEELILVICVLRIKFLPVIFANGATRTESSHFTASYMGLAVSYAVHPIFAHSVLLL